MNSYRSQRNVAVMLEESFVHWFHMGTVEHTGISLPLEEYDCGPKAIPSPFKGPKNTSFPDLGRLPSPERRKQWQ